MITPTFPFPYSGDVQHLQFSLITNYAQVIFQEHFCASLLILWQFLLSMCRQMGSLGPRVGASPTHLNLAKLLSQHWAVFHFPQPCWHFMLPDFLKNYCQFKEYKIVLHCFNLHYYKWGWVSFQVCWWTPLGFFTFDFPLGFLSFSWVVCSLVSVFSVSEVFGVIFWTLAALLLPVSSCLWLAFSSPFGGGNPSLVGLEDR